MTLSVIVSTRNRATRLGEFFAGLMRLEAPAVRWELVLVDNGSTDATDQAIRQFAAVAGFPVRGVHAATPGLSHARNAGLRHATGRLVAFTDDDCYPRPDYLRAIVDTFRRHRSGVLRRELAGASRYVLDRVVRGGSVPRFDPPSAVRT